MSEKGELRARPGSLRGGGGASVSWSTYILLKTVKRVNTHLFKFCLACYLGDVQYLRHFKETPEIYILCEVSILSDIYQMEFA